MGFAIQSAVVEKPHVAAPDDGVQKCVYLTTVSLMTQQEIWLVALHVH